MGLLAALGKAGMRNLRSGRMFGVSPAEELAGMVSETVQTSGLPAAKGLMSIIHRNHPPEVTRELIELVKQRHPKLLARPYSYPGEFDGPI